MNSSESFSPSVEKMPQPLDRQWFEKYRKLGVAILAPLNGDPENMNRQKDLFLAGEIGCPVADYASITEKQLKQAATKRKKLMDLSREISVHEKNAAVREAYLWAIDENLAKAALMKRVKEERWDEAQDLSDYVFGRPDKKLFQEYLGDFHQELAASARSVDDELRSAANELLEVLPQLPACDSQQPDESPRDLQVDVNLGIKLANMSEEVFGDATRNPLFKHGTADAIDIYHAFQEALAKFPGLGFEAEITTDRPSLVVSPAKKKIFIPATRQMDFTELAGKVAHEISHILKKRGDLATSKMLILSKGLDRMVAGEEATSIMIEEGIMRESEKYPRMDYHLAISLAAGLDGQPRNFAEVFVIMEKYYKYKLIRDKSEIENTDEESKNLAWARCVRTFRGTDYQTPGHFFGKDIGYLEGVMRMRAEFEKDPNLTEKILEVGKVDLSNERHKKILVQLGIIKDLTDI